MSIHRHAAKRDSNEGAIRKRFAHHGWHTEQVSAAGMPDLLAFNLRSTFAKGVRLVDVKDGNGQPTPAQVKKWTALHALGIPVYVVRTEDDVDALVGGTLAPWKPGPCSWGHPGCEIRHPMPPPRGLQAPSMVKAKRKPSANYRPPRSKLVNAAKEAEVCAPPECDCVGQHTAECIRRGCT